jgi:hypothetical protein
MSVYSVGLHGTISQKVVIFKVLVSETNEGNGEFSILCNKEIRDLYRSLHLVRLVKFVSLQWIVHDTQSHMEDEEVIEG